MNFIVQLMIITDAGTRTRAMKKNMILIIDFELVLLVDYQQN